MNLPLFFKPRLDRVALMAKGLKSVAHPFVHIHLMREYVVNVMRWSNLSEALASSAYRML